MKVLLHLAERGVLRGGPEERGERRGRRRRRLLLLLLPQYLLPQLRHHEFGHRLVIAVGQGLSQERMVEHVEGRRVLLFLLHDHQRLGGALRHDRVRLCRWRRWRWMRSAAHDDAPVLECQEGGDAVVGRQLLHALVDVVGLLQQLVLVREQTGV